MWLMTFLSQIHSGICFVTIWISGAIKFSLLFPVNIAFGISRVLLYCVKLITGRSPKGKTPATHSKMKHGLNVADKCKRDTEKDISVKFDILQPKENATPRSQSPIMQQIILSPPKPPRDLQLRQRNNGECTAVPKTKEDQLKNPVYVYTPRNNEECTPVPKTNEEQLKKSVFVYTPSTVGGYGRKLTESHNNDRNSHKISKVASIKLKGGLSATTSRYALSSPNSFSHQPSNMREDNSLGATAVTNDKLPQPQIIECKDIEQGNVDFPSSSQKISEIPNTCTPGNFNVSRSFVVEIEDETMQKYSSNSNNRGVYITASQMQNRTAKSFIEDIHHSALFGQKDFLLHKSINKDQQTQNIVPSPVVQNKSINNDQHTQHIVSSLVKPTLPAVCQPFGAKASPGYVDFNKNSTSTLIVSSASLVNQTNKNLKYIPYEHYKRLKSSTQKEESIEYNNNFFISRIEKGRADNRLPTTPKYNKSLSNTFDVKDESTDAKYEESSSDSNKTNDTTSSLERCQVGDQDDAVKTKSSQNSKIDAKLTDVNQNVNKSVTRKNSESVINIHKPLLPPLINQKVENYIEGTKTNKDVMSSSERRAFDMLSDLVEISGTKDESSTSKSSVSQNKTTASSHLMSGQVYFNLGENEKIYLNQNANKVHNIPIQTVTAEEKFNLSDTKISHPQQTVYLDNDSGKDYINLDRSKDSQENVVRSSVPDIFRGTNIDFNTSQQKQKLEDTGSPTVSENWKKSKSTFSNWMINLLDEGQEGHQSNLESISTENSNNPTNILDALNDNKSQGSALSDVSVTSNIPIKTGECIYTEDPVENLIHENITSYPDTHTEQKQISNKKLELIECINVSEMPRNNLNDIAKESNGRRGSVETISKNLLSSLTSFLTIPQSGFNEQSLRATDEESNDLSALENFLKPPPQVNDEKSDMTHLEKLDDNTHEENNNEILVRCYSSEILETTNSVVEEKENEYEQNESPKTDNSNMTEVQSAVKRTLENIRKKAEPFEQEIENFTELEESNKYYYIEESLRRLIDKLDDMFEEVESDDFLREERKQVFRFIFPLFDKLDEKLQENKLRRENNN